MAENEAQRRLSASDSELLTQHVALVTASGRPLASGLRAAAEESTSPRVAAALNTIANQVESGQTLEAVLAESHRWLPPHVGGLLLAAARTGNLGHALADLAEHQRVIRTMRRSVSSALAYPGVVVALAILVFLFLMLFVVGIFRTMFEEFELSLPAVTHFLMWLHGWGPMLLLVGMLAVLFVAIAVRLGGGRVAWLWLIKTLPIFGPLWKWSALAEWSNLLNVLIKYKIQLPEALQLAADGVSDDQVRQLSAWLAQGTASGETLSEMLTASPRLPASLIPLLRWGEKTGLLADAFRAGREMFEVRVRTRSLLLQSILPPMLFIALGFSVGFLIIALFMPMVSMVCGLSG